MQLSKNSLLITLIGLSIMVVLISVLQGMLTLDPHHWGLMLGNAKDLYEGRRPYQEIFIQYGIGTTLIHSFAYGIGKNLISLIFVTSFFYAAGMVVIFFAAVNVLKNETHALYVFISIFLLHPLAMLPWANYLAFPFIAFGLYVFTLQNSSRLQLFLAGISLGLAVLVREGLAPAVLALILSVSIIDLLFKNYSKKDLTINFILTCAGIAIPILCFFSYLFGMDLFSSWTLLAYQVPKIAIDEDFPGFKEFIFKDILSKILTGFRHGDPRWILMGFSILANIYIGISYITGRKKSYITSSLLKISLAALLLLSSSLHMANIFRLATGSAVGLIGLYALLISHKKERLFFIVSTIWLTLTIGLGNRENMFLPTIDYIKKSRQIEDISLFQGQLWEPIAIDYYHNIEKDLVAISKLSCGIKYQYNNTIDSFFPIISPLKQLQIAPYKTSKRMDALRPELNFSHEIDSGTSIAILDFVPKGGDSKFVSLNKYTIFSRHTVPSAYFIKENQELLLMVPTYCIN